MAVSTIPYYGISEEKSWNIIEEVRKSVSKWQETASKYNIPRLEQEVMYRAFEK
ncbi:MAG: hypothetical protein R3Y26_00485 [Rikenellaceae bacterium]